MCRLFIGADPLLWQSVTRSVRIDGVATSIRLESFFWSILDDIGERDGMSVGRLIGRLYVEIARRRPSAGKFHILLAGLLRPLLALQLDGLVPTDRHTPIAALDAESILVREERRYAKPGAADFPRAVRGH